MPYSEVTIAGYNASPPPDDGTQVAANEVTWAGIKSKIGDPLKSAIETTQTNITSVIDSEIEANLWAPPTTATIFYQQTPPTNWTKSVTDNDKAIRIVSGSTGGTAHGSTAFSSVLAARTITQGNLPAYDLSFSLAAASHAHTYSGTTGTESADHAHGFSGSTSTNGDHSHSYNDKHRSGSTTRDSSGGTQVNQGEDDSGRTTGNAGSHAHTFSGTTGGRNAAHTHGFSGTTSASGSLGVSGTISLGGSGGAMDFAIQYMDCIVATKDT